MRGLVIFLVRGYQALIRPLIGPCCRFTPSCSEYAVQAVGRHGILIGSCLVFYRLVRCAPWGGYGYDPVPNRFFRTKSLK